jgi:hypothetical protein
VSVNELNLEQQLELKKKILEAQAVEKQASEKVSSMHTGNKARAFSYRF